MSEFDAQERHYNPYRNFKYRLKWHGRPVAGFNRAAALPREQSRYEPITLERGVTHDVEFEQWATRSSKKGDEPEVLPRDITIAIFDEAGQLAQAFKVHRCRASSYQALPELDANSNAVAIQSITLQHEGWERL